MVKLKVADYQGVAFDFDGTLADANHVHEAQRMVAFEERGLGHITMEQHQKGHSYGTNPHTIIAGVLYEAGELEPDADPFTHPLVTSLVVRKRELYQEQAEHGLLNAHDGAIEMVKFFNTAYHLNMAIVTTAMLGEIKPFIGRYALESIFVDDHLVTDDTVKEQGLQLKPAPDAYLLAAKIMDISDVSKLLVIEDSTGGVEAGKRAGATTIAVGTTNAHDVFYDDKLTHHPDYFFADFHELFRAFQQ